jgi:hypothetical protein
MKISTRTIGSIPMLVLAALSACGESTPTILEAGRPLSASAPSPMGVVEVTSADESVRLWPFTDTNFEATPQDPINLVFFGEADPRNVRDALLGLNGTRAGPFASFNCIWTDAIGGHQTSYSTVEGWSGSAIQLECGSYSSIRFHLRLFSAGGATMANAHFDLLIPGTTDHQVLTWELGESFVTYDLARSGFLAAPPAQSGGINPGPTFRDIPAVIYNGVPASLRALTGGPLTGNVNAPVGIPSNGSATILRLLDAPAATGSSQDFVLIFGQTIPKPFCNAGGKYLRVDGPVRLRQTVEVSESGTVSSQTFAEGDLVTRTVNPSTGAIGEQIPAHVRDHYTTMVGDGVTSVHSMRKQRLIDPNAPEQLHEQLRVGPRGGTNYRRTERCN